MLALLRYNLFMLYYVQIFKQKILIGDCIPDFELDNYILYFHRDLLIKSCIVSTFLNLGLILF